MNSSRSQRIWEIGAVAVIVALAAVFTFSGFAKADINNPHPVPPANTVTTSMLKDGIVTSPKLSETDTFYMKALVATTTTASSTTITGDLTAPASTTFNGVHYKWPSADGTSGQLLNTDGSGNLGFTSVSNTYTASPFTSYDNLTAGDAVRLTTDTTQRDATSTGSIGTGNTSLTFAHTTSGTNRTLIVFGYSLSIANTMSATYNGVSMTLAHTSQAAGYGTTFAFVLVNPAIGTNNVVLTYTDSTKITYGWAVSVTGTYQTSQPNNSADQAANTASTITCSNTTTVDNATVYMLGVDTGGSITAGTNSTIIGIDSSGFMDLFDTSGVGAKSPAGSIGMTYSGASGNFGGTCIAIAPLTTPGLREAKADISNNSKSFIGFAAATVSSGATSTVYTSGIASVFTGLIPGTQYYLSNTAGALSSTAGSVSRKACISTSATDCLITNIW